eukprot:2373756-Pyramimonas_sp.AAC.1
MIPTGVKLSFGWEIAMYKSNLATHDIHFSSNLPAGRPAMTFGDAPAEKETLQSTSASRLFPTCTFSATVPYQKLLPHRQSSFCWVG